VLNEVTDFIYISNTQSNDVTVIGGGADNTSTVSLSGSTADSAVTVNPVTNLIYVANDSRIRSWPA
jgi:DNA-binding beta-propeller fold protein YncE